MSLSFLAAARECPDRPAVVREGKIHRYGDLAPLVRGGIVRLRDLAKERGDRPVAIEATPDPEMLVRIYALIESGVPFLPIHPAWSDATREEALSRAVLFDEPIAPMEEGPPEAPSRFHDSDPLALLHTSGSTGKPKRVVLSRRAFAASAAASAANLGWKEEDRWAICIPLAHVGGLSIVTRTLLARKAVALAAPFDANSLVRSIERDRITLLSAVPTMLHALLRLEPPWRPPEHLRAVLLGGGPIDPALLREGRERGVPLLPTYGLTETCSQVATFPYDTRHLPGGAARPLPGIGVRIARGRIEVGGPTLLTSYDPPDAHPDPFTEDGWFRTGDGGFLDDEGFLHVEGRLDGTIVTGGENVDPREVEKILERHPNIRRAFVFGVADGRWGEIVAAAVEWRPREEADPEGLGAFLVDRLASFQRPRRIAFVDDLPPPPRDAADRPARARRFREHLKEFPYPR